MNKKYFNSIIIVITTMVLFVNNVNAELSIQWINLTGDFSLDDRLLNWKVIDWKDSCSGGCDWNIQGNGTDSGTDSQLWLTGTPKNISVTFSKESSIIAIMMGGDHNDGYFELWIDDKFISSFDSYNKSKTLVASNLNFAIHNIKIVQTGDKNSESEDNHVAVFGAAALIDMKTLIETKVKYSSTFDNNDESWRYINDVNLSWTFSGGNTGGYLQGNDVGDGRIWFFVSPETWSGDWSQCTKFSYDLNLIDTGEDANFFEVETLRIIGVNGKEMKYTETTNNYPDNSWKTYSLDITHSSFDVTEDIFQSIIQNVKEVWIRGEYTNKHDIEGIDNVILQYQQSNNKLCDINDSDMDGVIDQWDTCHQTAEHSATYSNGCKAHDIYIQINELKQEVIDQNQIIDQKNRIIIELNSSVYEKGEEIKNLQTTIDNMYSKEDMEGMVKNLLNWGDTNGDGKIGLDEAIKALMITSGISSKSNKGVK
ncbi:conserved hypothetical protein, secreted [Candidatus Magnetomorum sp. HK-1]|nr:conserved hypothetical protein, secreted [Candidatus Magnetomorum sp. HK-1]